MDVHTASLAAASPTISPEHLQPVVQAIASIPQDSSSVEPKESEVICGSSAEAKGPVSTDGEDSRDVAAAGGLEGENQRKRKRHIPDTDTEIMDHSGLQVGVKKHKTMYKDGVLLCNPFSLDGLESKTQKHVTRELTRCLHEPKAVLIGEVVRVLGIEKALEIFQKTATIQETGGMATADGNKKRAPGGVFLTLVKGIVNKEQKQEIFQKEKQISYAKKRRQKKKANDHKMAVESNPSKKSPTEFDCLLDQVTTRVEKNVHKRLGQRPNNHDNPSIEPEAQIESESKAAEDFELMTDYDLDIGVD